MGSFQGGAGAVAVHAFVRDAVGREVAYAFLPGIGLELGKVVAVDVEHLPIRQLDLHDGVVRWLVAGGRDGMPVARRRR